MLSQSRAHKSEAFASAPLCYSLLYLPQLTLQNGMIPSFVFVVIGVAIAKQVQATATTRIKVLTACFMAFSLHCGSPGSGNPKCHELYSYCQVCRFWAGKL